LRIFQIIADIFMIGDLAGKCKKAIIGHMGMNNTCGVCRYGHDKKPGGQRPPAGTVWCPKRNMAMGKNRRMKCFVSLAGKGAAECRRCRWARKSRPDGVPPKVGHVWCDKRDIEIAKMRNMECFTE
jgi:hypothetical protein